MVKIIVADRKHDCTHLLGQFLDESHYDLLLEEDCDVYAPPDCDVATTADCDVHVTALTVSLVHTSVE